MKTKLCLILLVAALSPIRLKAVDWSQVVDLTGKWLFTVGDDPDWSKPGIKADDWDMISVPGEWERHYPGYNGFAWYRREFDITVLPGNGRLTLFLGKIDDADEVFVNGIKVGQTGSFFPDFKSAYSVERIYQLPVGLLKPGRNLIAVRVYDELLDGGLLGGQRIGIYYDNDIDLLAFDLSGSWKFSIYRERNYYQEQFDDKNWSDVQVPGCWEDQGFKSHDGYGWYRKQFILPPNKLGEAYYLVLGRIDDNDKVYLNGRQLGRTEDLPQYYEYDKSLSWLLYRAYPIPEGVLKRINTIAVEVYDHGGDGGIYEGPIGLATPADAKELLGRHIESNYSQSFWSIFRYIFD